jgi:hypothetical protein
MDTNTKLKITLGTILIVGIIAMTIVSIGFSMNNKDKPVVTISKDNYTNQTHTIDSLTRVVDSLKIEIIALEDGFDYKEHRYEDIIFQYELGLSYLKDYHSESYRAFHRFLAHKENYSKKDERENIKILSIKEL